MEDFIDQKKYYPTLVSNIYGIKEKGEGIIRTQKIKQLPQKAQDILFSDEIVELIYNIERKYNLNDISTEEISRSIRQYFLREITQELFIQKIAQLCHTTEQEANVLLQKINAITPKKDEEEKQIIEITLQKAIEKYPNILQQIITKKPIVSKPFLKPLKPTIKNWIMVYEKIIGVESHDAIKRGEFLFRSDAARGLSSVDRDKLSKILKSRDENSTINVDLGTQQIVFDVSESVAVTDVKNSESPPQPIQKQNTINSVVIDELQKEITKNRLELQEKKINQNNTNTQQTNIQNSAQIQSNNNQRQIGTPIQKVMPQANGGVGVNNQVINQNQQQAQTTKPPVATPKPKTMGKISFSSKHVLPVEKEQNI